MRRNLILFFLLIFSRSLWAFTVTCPTVDEIKNNHLGYWIPLYQTGEEMISTDDLITVQKHISQFQMAIWNRDYLESAHCFYMGNDPIFTKIVFAQDAWRPESNAAWQWLVPKAQAECFGQIAECGFIK